MNVQIPLRNSIVVLDDDPLIAKIIEKVTKVNTICFQSNANLLANTKELQPMAVFVDIHVGENDNGLDVIPELRQSWPILPILVITSDPSDELIREALSIGANDFIRKPINHTELLARLQSRMYDSSEKVSATIVAVGDLKINKNHNSIAVGEAVRFLSKKEIELILVMSEANGTVVVKNVIKKRLWGPVAVSDNSLNRKVFEVREALRELESRVQIRSVYGQGFSIFLDE